MIARAAIAATAIARRRRRSARIDADFIVPLATGEMAALDRRGLRPGAVRGDAAVADRDRARRVSAAANAMRASDAAAEQPAQAGDRVVRAY